MERLSLLDQLFGNPDWLSDLLGRKVDTIWDTTPTALFTPAATTPGQWAAAVSDMLVDNGLLPIGSDDHGRGCGCLGCSGLRDIDIDAQREAASQGQRDGTAVAAEYGVGTIDPSIAFAAQGAIPDPTPGQDPNAATLGEMADFLRADYWNGTSFKYNLGDSGPNPNNGVITYNVSGFSNKAGVTDSNGISGARGNLVREAFKVFEAVLGIEFVETTSANADFFFADNQGGAYASSRGFQNGLEYTLINVASNWSGGTSTYNDYTLQTIFHEIGHGLGLGHQGYYNGSGGWPNDAVFVNDSWQGSMMSYFSQIENQAINATGAYLQTPMAVDWLALDALYGGDQSGGKTFGIQNAFKGDTVYGFNTNINSSVSDIWAKFADYADRTASTIIDGDGIDTLDVSGYSADQKINLKVATASDVVATVSDIGGLVGNLTLAVGTVIENAVGGSGDDQFWGNAAANQFVGNGGNDTFYDSEGSDEYRGGSGTDTATFGFDFADYSFQVAGSFLEVVHVSAQATIDLVENTVEWLSFADQTVSFSEAAAGATGGGGPPPPPPPPPDGDDVVDGAGLGDAGNTLGAATDIALDSDGNATINGSVGFDNDTNDYFKFVAAQSGSASFVLTGMSQSAYTRLYENGNQVASTGANNANDKTLTFDLVAGAEYVVKVDPWGSAETDYRLAIDTPAGGGGPAPLPTVTVDQAADNAGSTTGTIAQGGVTDDNSPTLSGSLSASLGSGQSVTIYRDGAAVGTATVNGQSWSFIDGSVGEGAHTWTARVVEPGREGDVSSGFGFTVDRTAPSVTVDSLTTTDGTPALSGTVNDPDATVSVTVNGQTAQATNSGNGTWSLVWAAVLAPGTYNVEARATDFAGNVGIDATSSELVIETSPPPPPATGNDVVNGADIGDGGNTLGAATAIALDSDGDAVIDGSVGFGDDTNDYFEFVAVGSGSASFALTGMSDSAYTRLFENGSQVASTGADNANDKTLTYDLTEGSIYVIKVDPWGSAETDYDLAINTPVGGAPPPPSGGDVVNGIGVGDAGNTLGAATSISLNGNGDANIVGSVGFGGDSNDYFKFVAPATGTATIELTGLSQSAYTRFYENGSQVANTGANNTGDKSLTYDLQAGVEYVVKVDPWGSAETDYDLQIDLLL